MLKTATPLDDALKLWEPLEKFAGTRIETWISGFEIYIRKGQLTLSGLLRQADKQECT
jgi:hypothetical protein